jgi:hypothetical protein
LLDFFITVGYVELNLGRNLLSKELYILGSVLFNGVDRQYFEMWIEKLQEVFELPQIMM